MDLRSVFACAHCRLRVSFPYQGVICFFLHARMIKNTMFLCISIIARHDSIESLCLSFLLVRKKKPGVLSCLGASNSQTIDWLRWLTTLLACAYPPIKTQYVLRASFIIPLNNCVNVFVIFPLPLKIPILLLPTFAFLPPRSEHTFLTIFPFSGWNLCFVNNGDCSHLCLARPGQQRTCSCPMHFKLLPDNKTCEGKIRRITIKTA